MAITLPHRGASFSGGTSARGGSIGGTATRGRNLAPQALMDELTYRANQCAPDAQIAALAMADSGHASDIIAAIAFAIQNKA